MSLIIDSFMLSKLVINRKDSLPYCAWSFFTKKHFFSFLFKLTKGFALGTLVQYSAFKPEEKGVLVRKRPSGGAVGVEVAEGRQEVEDCRNFLVDEEKFFLDALGLDFFPWPLLGLFPLLEKLWALFLELFGL